MWFRPWTSEHLQLLVMANPKLKSESHRTTKTSDPWRLVGGMKKRDLKHAAKKARRKVDRKILNNP